MSQVQSLLESHSDWSAVVTIYHKLKAHGYRAFLAGGCVRDALLGRKANDLDLATDATPEQIEDLFARTVNVGKSFGVMRVLIDDADIEVATFRADGEYLDGRRPEGVIFSSPMEDAQRRDFTVNALFFDLDTHQVLDFVEGEVDLHQQVLRTVGDPAKRFAEDHLRLLRAARFVSQLDFTVEEQTFKAVQRMAPLVKSVSGERIRDEIVKLLKGKSVERGLDVMLSSGLLEQLFPFRLRDNSWQESSRAHEPWQYLALFFRAATLSELSESLKMLKLSGKEQKAIEKAWKVWEKPDLFFQSTRGKILQAIAEPGILFAVQTLKDEKSFWEASAQDILQDWSAWGGVLPSPFLRGEDLKGLLSGREMGQCLAEAFELQLEKKLLSRAQALQWIPQFLKRDSNG